MARTTKIACEGAIYTVRSDVHGTVIETDLDAAAEVPPESDESMSDEHARYAQMIQELTEFEDAVAQAEARSLLYDDGDDEAGEDTDSLS